jgi:hypothetical protein
MSPFTSIKNLVEDKTKILHHLVKERFENLNNIKKVMCPTFILHG